MEQNLPPTAAPNEPHRAETTWFHVFHSMFWSGDAAKMGPYAVTVYLAIKAHANFKTGASFPEIDTIVAKSSISRRQVMRVLIVLEDFGYLTRRREGRHNVYQLREKILIRDKQGRPTAVATWDYVPTSVQAATADLKNVLLSGEFGGSKTIHVERLQINVTHASGNAVVLNAQEVAGLPQEMRNLLLSLKTAMAQRSLREVVHRPT